MANIILTWEYERDITHITRLKYLQKKLSQMGHQVYMIGAHLSGLEENENIPFLPAPRAAIASIHKPRSVTKIGGYSDRLAILGFNDAKTLRSLVATWDNLFELLKPQLLICDCAPVASLAAYKHIPCIQLSDGLSLPPHHLTDFPRLRPDAPPLASSQTMLQNVHIVQNQRNKSKPPYLPAILESDYTFITHVPEFDPYLTFRNNSAVTFGPFSNLPAYSVQHERNHFFAYLDLSFPDIEETIIGMTGLKKTGIFYLQGASYSLQQFITQSGHVVCEQFPALDEILNQCAFVIHHGNIAVAEAALSAGIPQFTLPTHFDSDWISHFLVNIGVCVAMYPEFNPVTTTAIKINAALEVEKGYKNHNLREWSTLRAQHLKQKNYMTLETSLISACEHLLR